MESTQISVIIPVLNEANWIEKLLQSLQSAPVEIIIVDGGSQDQTVKQATAMGAKVLQSAPGRAIQMNAGAKAATGEILLFLHADTRLPEGFVDFVEHTLSQPGTIAGAFDLNIDGTALGLRWVEWGVKWRSRLWQLPYGDQAIFLKAQTFHHLKGFAELPIMEDFDLVRRLQTQGKISIIAVPVLTSGRRWQKLGIFRTTWINQLTLAAYRLGIPPDQIARWHQKNRG